MDRSITKRIDAITEITPEYRRVSPPCPKSVKIELTARCNFACSFCARSKVLRTQKDMDLDLYKKLVKEMRLAGVEELGVFYLGESFMVKWLPEAIRFAKDLGYPYVFLTTNGSLCNAKKVKACMEAGLDSLKFSMNWTDVEQFTEIARVKPSIFEVIIANIKGAHEIREYYEFDCGLYASYIQYTGEQGKLIQGVMDRIGPYVDEIYALPLYNQASLLTEDEKAKGWEPSPGVTGRADNPRDPLPCWALFTAGHVTYDGKLSACCFDHDGRFNMGDLTKISFMEAWQSKKFKKLRVAHLKKDVTNTVCEQCVVYS